MDVELLVVPECPHQATAVELLRTAIVDLALPDEGLRVTVIASESEATQRGFTGSPTFLIGGIDPFAEPGRPIGMSCRIYHQAEGLRGVPGLTELREALRHLVDPGASPREGQRGADSGR